MSLLDRVQIVLWAVIAGVFLAEFVYIFFSLSHHAERQRGGRARLLASLGMCAMFVGMATPLALPMLLVWVSGVIGFCGILLFFVTLVVMLRRPLTSPRDLRFF